MAKPASFHGSAPLSPSAMIGEDTVLIFVPVLDRPPTGYRRSIHGMRLFDESGRPGPVLRIPPQADAAIQLGRPVSVVEVDEQGPARSSRIQELV